mmetsp:Transcript_35882/g.64130  ORF Transcript_35882/g.64130 Transcript_35882/m.64130 type:complete len:242 (+) Transcript_35882:604-1329(+)
MHSHLLSNAHHIRHILRDPITLVTGNCNCHPDIHLFFNPDTHFYLNPNPHSNKNWTKQHHTHTHNNIHTAGHVYTIWNPYCSANIHWITDHTGHYNDYRITLRNAQSIKHPNQMADVNLHSIADRVSFCIGCGLSFCNIHSITHYHFDSLIHKYALRVTHLVVHSYSFAHTILLTITFTEPLSICYPILEPYPTIHPLLNSHLVLHAHPDRHQVPEPHNITQSKFHPDPNANPQPQPHSQP